ncbi:MAG TPA: hypothetical protein VMR62_10315 [Bryobacteraceae bacterium]|jgi:hypothetical protein|nr:hypothetical protein [Bryobacteraceae bacterium]
MSDLRRLHHRRKLREAEDCEPRYATRQIPPPPFLHVCASQDGSVASVELHHQWDLIGLDGLAPAPPQEITVKFLLAFWY